MLREIKFRVWCKNKKEWENDYTFINDIGNVFHQNESGYTVSFSPTTHIVEQFTGLHDKNGLEIYEGDFVEIGFQFKIKEAVFFEKGVFRTETNALAVFNENCSVVGNIHQVSLMKQ